jgi:hypothetical protein
MTDGGISAAAASLQEVLGNRSIRRLELSWIAGTAADLAFLVTLLVVAYDEGGVVAVGLLGAIRMLPATIAGFFAPTLVARMRGDRVLAGINVLRCTGALATAAVIATDMPIALTYVLAAVVAGAGSLVRPIQTALLPAFARTPRELVAANVASSVGEGLGTFVGPVAAGIVVAASGSVAASLIVAAVFAGAAALLSGLHFERAADAHGGPVVGDKRGGFPLLRAARTILAYRGASLVIGGLVMQVFVRGLLVILIVVAAIELLDMGDSGVGVLNAAIGLGGLVGGLAALSLARAARLPTVFALALAGWGLPIAVIGVSPEAAVAVTALFVTGLSNAVLDVSGFTLVQRGVRNEDRMLVFGVMEGLFGLALLLGSLAAPVLDGALGTRGALLVAGAILPLVALSTWHPVAGSYADVEVRERRLSLLRRNPLFAPLPLTALDRLAESMEPVAYESGQILMRKGDRGDCYVLLESGEVAVTDGGRRLATCGAGQGVGEIALLRSVPRTASVVALAPVTAFEIQASVFLEAVAGPSAQAAAETLVEARLAAGPA